MSGFTYNGVHCSDFGVEYIPDAEARWFIGTEYNVYDNDVAWKNGGYYYGNRAKNRVFKLNCYFEEITTKQREDIRQWLHRNTYGRLVFDDIPFVYWNVRPTVAVPGKIYNDCGKYSGTFTVQFTAYNPFGFLTRKYNTQADDDNANDYCDLIDESDMPMPPRVNSRRFNVYNPGREQCGLSIELIGSTQNPIMFLNNTNKTNCIICSLPTGGLCLGIDGETGNALVYENTATTYYESGFAYHDRGIVRLEPGINELDILEQTASGNWSATTTLELTHIKIDYHPRIL